MTVNLWVLLYIFISFPVCGEYMNALDLVDGSLARNLVAERPKFKCSV